MAHTGPALVEIVYSIISVSWVFPENPAPASAVCVFLDGFESRMGRARVARARCAMRTVRAPIVVKCPPLPPPRNDNNNGGMGGGDGGAGGRK